MSIVERLQAKNIVLPRPIKPQAAYIPCVQSSNLLFVSGQGTLLHGQRLFTGKVGDTISVENAYQAARITGLNLLSQMQAYLGDLEKISKIIHVKIFVASTKDFFDQSAVANGVSDLLLEVFGSETGSHTRSAIGVYVLPNNICVESELIAEIKKPSNSS